MKYKKSLIIPTIISTGLFTSTMVISADEMDSEENAPQEITETEIVETQETETQEDPAAQSEVDTETTQDDTNADTQTGKTETAPEKETQPEVPADEKTAESVETDENQPEETNDENSLDDTDLHNGKEENSTEETGNQENSSDAPEHQQIEEEDSIDDAESQDESESVNASEQNNQENTSESEMTEETVEENNINDAESQEEAESENDTEPDVQKNTSGTENTEETEEENHLDEKDLQKETKGEGAPPDSDVEENKNSEEGNSPNEEMTDNNSEGQDSEKDNSGNKDDQNEEQSVDNDEKFPDEEEPILEEEVEMSIFSQLQDDSTPVYTDAQLAARINSSDNAGLFSPLWSEDSVSADRFMDSTLYATRQADYNNETYYLTFNGIDGAMQGWMKGQDLDLLQHSSPSSHDGDYYINPSQNSQYLLDEPWGNSNQRVTQLNQYNHNDVFNAEQSINVGDLTFYYGSIGNDYGWVQSSHVTSNTPEPPANEPEVTTIQYDYSLEEVLDIQMNLGTPPQAWVDGGGWRNATRDEVRQFVDTSNHEGGAWDYTFLNLDESQGLSASVLDNNLLSNRGILTNQGNAFAQASETHGVNEVYLISHAILETGHGESQLAQGVTLDSNGNISNSGTTYYNMYGIGAVDNNALLGGARYAQQMGWDTPAKAIIGGANFVSQNYFNRGQNTLYSMRWNPENPGSYQYATDVNWAHATARNIQSYYNTLGVEGRYFTRYTF